MVMHACESKIRMEPLRKQTQEGGMQQHSAFYLPCYTPTHNLGTHPFLTKALFLKDQIEEQRQRRRAEKESKRIEAAGYWGPEDPSCITAEGPAPEIHICLPVLETRKVYRF